MRLNNLSLRSLLSLLVILGILGSVTNGLVALLGTRTITEGIGEIVKTQRSTRMQADIDMMHDAVRGDVFQAVLAQTTGDAAMAESASSAFTEHADNMRKLFADNASAVQDASLRQQVEPVLTRYLDSAKAIVSRPLSAPVAPVEPSVPAEGVAPAIDPTPGVAPASDPPASAAPAVDPALQAELAAFMKDFDALEDMLGKMTSDVAGAADAQHLLAAATSERISVIASMTAVLAAISLLIAAVVVYRMIGPPLGRLVRVADSIVASGDLTQRLAPEGSNEIAVAMRAVDRLVEAQQAIVKDVRRAAEHVNDAVAGMRELSSDARTDAHTQRGQVDNAVERVEGLESSILQVGSSAQRAQQVAGEAGERSRNSASVVLETASDMNRIAHTVQETARAVASLESEAQAIAAVIATIKGIADQTNLLALNAAIEAARAGEQGRGFAVVADEVRKLAEHTSVATDQISRTIETVQATIHEAVASIDLSVTGVSSGVLRAREAGDAVGAIPAAAAEVSSAMQDIATAVDHQQQAGRVIFELVRGMKDSAARNADNAQRVADVSTGAGESMDELLRSTRRFTV